MAEPAEVRFEDVPSSHAGSGTFGFRIVFSEAVTITQAAFRNHALQVTGGSVTAASRASGWEGAWAVTIAPSSWESVEVRLPAGRPCEEAGAICAEDGRHLSTGFIKQIPGPTPVDVVTGFILVDTSWGAGGPRRSGPLVPPRCRAGSRRPQLPHPPRHVARPVVGCGRTTNRGPLAPRAADQGYAPAQMQPRSRVPQNGRGVRRERAEAGRRGSGARAPRSSTERAPRRLFADRDSCPAEMTGDTLAFR